MVEMLEKIWDAMPDRHLKKSFLLAFSLTSSLMFITIEIFGKLGFASSPLSWIYFGIIIFAWFYSITPVAYLSQLAFIHFDWKYKKIIEEQRSYEEKKAFEKRKKDAEEREYLEEIFSIAEMDVSELQEKAKERGLDYSGNADVIRHRLYPEEFEHPDDLELRRLDKLANEKMEVEKRKKQSRRISKEVRDLVWNRDGGHCQECGTEEKLEFDHIIPFSKGGSNSDSNIQILCQKCNRSKSNKIG